MINVRRNFGNSSDQQGGWQNGRPSRKIEEEQNVSLHNDFFISINSGLASSFKKHYQQTFSFSTFFKGIKLFVINFINRLWWGPTYPKLKRPLWQIPKKAEPPKKIEKGVLLRFSTQNLSPDFL